MRLPTETPLYYRSSWGDIYFGPDTKEHEYPADAFDDALEQTEALVKDLSKAQLRVLLRRHRAALYQLYRRQRSPMKHYDAEAAVTVDPITQLIEDELLEREADGDPPRI